MYLTTVNRLPFYGPITKFKCYKLTVIIIRCIIAIYALVLGKIIEAIYMILGHLLLYYFYHITLNSSCGAKWLYKALSMKFLTKESFKHD